MRLFTTLMLALSLMGCSSPEEPKKEKEEVSARDVQRSFIGNWRVFNDEGDYFYITINPDGSASSTWGMGQKGEWEVDNDRVVLHWTDGWKDILYKENDRIQKISFKPGESTYGDPTSRANAERVDTIPSNY